jgi:hypothetical protein
VNFFSDCGVSLLLVWLLQDAPERGCTVHTYNVDFTMTTVDIAIGLPLEAIVQYVLKDFGWDLDIHVELLLLLFLRHVSLNVIDNIFSVP